MRTSTRAPGAPTHRRTAGQRVGGDRQQELGTGEDPEVNFLVIRAQSVPHGGLGLGGRLPFGHGHLPSTEEATGIAYNLQGKNKITMHGLCGIPRSGGRR
ncbi:hypothetical protein Prubr_21800 [Polymorphospora rubra]|uniref:Uncharacterized protein n=1 Tax=Polymorphospora rubra TaxID=338584 RepID=A0A810MYX5_9ACTN|nr:hypothetical protein Prubr_21800 [Polymorphospora rubra]